MKKQRCEAFNTTTTSLGDGEGKNTLTTLAKNTESVKGIDATLLNNLSKTEKSIKGGDPCLPPIILFTTSAPPSLLTFEDDDEDPEAPTTRALERLLLCPHYIYYEVHSQIEEYRQRMEGMDLSSW